MMQKIYVGIVTYCPERNRLEENIQAIHTQAEKVVVFDNGSPEQHRLRTFLSRYPNVELLESPENIGIAAALNRLMQWGYERGYEWMVSLDQDSVCECQFISRLLPYLSAEPKLGIVAPVIRDRNIGIIGHHPQNIYEHVAICITSGACSNLAAWNAIGGYDEFMFIDSVDFEFCYRMRKYGYGVIQVRDVELLHELGHCQKRRFLCWKVIISGHNAFRKYYIARNNLYYPLKHHLWLHALRGTIRNAWMVLEVLLYEDDKKAKLMAIFKGWTAALLYIGKT